MTARTATWRSTRTGGDNFVQIATPYGVTSLAAGASATGGELDDLITSGNLIVA